MFCERCGSRIDDDRFCPRCGSPVGADRESEEAAFKDWSSDVVPPVTTSPVVAPSHLAAPRRKGSIAPFVALGALVVVLVVGLAVAVIDPMGWFSDNRDAPEASSTEDGSLGSSDSVGSSGSSASTAADAGASSDEIALGSGDPYVEFTGMTSASATSYLAFDEIYAVGYEPANAIDGDTSTTWCEGVSGNGEGESITLSSGSKQTISGFVIYAGYQESDFLYEINSRPKGIVVRAEGETVVTVTLDDAGCTGQDVVFDSPVYTDTLTIEITSAYSGSRYEDCCVSEIECY